MNDINEIKKETNNMLWKNEEDKKKKLLLGLETPEEIKEKYEKENLNEKK